MSDHDPGAVHPAMSAIQALALLHQAKATFPYSEDFRRNIDRACCDVAAWAVGLVADMEREQQCGSNSAPRSRRQQA